MTDIATNIKLLKKQLPASVKLVAVSKTKSISDILEAYNSGHKSFGENRVQELLQKKAFLPSDIEWHLLGHLQTNKVKYIIPFISMIESVDSFRLMRIINFEAGKIPKVIECLLQIHIAEEESKFGFSMDEIHKVLGAKDFSGMNYLKICGVMGMATFTRNAGQIRKEFRYLVSCFHMLKKMYFEDNQNFKEISMGMSDDYQIAIEEGSTIVRIGTLVFGER